MAAQYRALLLAWLVLPWTIVSPPALGDEKASSGPAATHSSAGLLTFTGTVHMPDGRPAVGATVKSISQFGDAAAIARTNDAGRFQLQGLFGSGAKLHVISADGNHQATYGFSALAARVTFASPLKLTLSPSATHEVAVVSSGRPVKGAEVAGSTATVEVHGITGQDGKVQLQHPAREPLEKLSAWHPELGVGGVRDLADRLPHDKTELSLLPPGPHTIRVVSAEGKPVGGLELGINVCPEEFDWIVVHDIEAAHVRTDAQGTAVVPWMPREKLRFVEVELLGSDWKIDEVDRDEITRGITTVHVRHARTVEGRLKMPEGKSALGILIGGYGFGPGHHSDIPRARAQQDGSFSLRVFSEHGYLLGVTDLEWASDLWTGQILKDDTAAPAEITINVYPATPLTARVTRGPEHTPIALAWVELETNGQVKWLDSKGQSRSGRAGVFGWLRTDASGIARAGVGRGEQKLSLSSGNWRDERKLKVSSRDPIAIEFHRPWLGKRKITGRLMRDKAFYEPSPALVARAWTPESRQAPLVAEPKVFPNGAFEVTFDAENLVLLFVDPPNHQSGFATAALGDTALSVAMEPAATYRGTLLDENGHPFADRTLRFYMKEFVYEPVAPQRTGTAGRFEFTDVPANVPLYLTIDFKGDRPDYVLHADRAFTPGEVREHDQVTPRPTNSPPPVPRQVVPLTARIKSICRDASSSRMHALVVLEGDSSQHVVRSANRLLDHDQARSVLGYVTLRVDAALLKAEAATIERFGWPIPAPGELVLLALKGDREVIACKRVTTEKLDAAFQNGEGFLTEHMPPARDALAGLAEARKAAKESGRRVWIIEGGPRCGPCFRLAHWIEDHHAVLDRDFVIVKVMDGLDEHAGDVIDKLPIKDHGVPWHAITEPDGKILITSEGPLGNIGFPVGSLEGVRHFRRMLERTVKRLTPDEIDGLIKSLSPEK
jgi:hypothetical protein